MRLHILSDLHLEMRRTSWRPLVDAIPGDLGDVLVLAGDVLCLAAEEEAREMLGALRRKARHVIYVLGNHEHYHGAFAETGERAARVCAAADVTLLDQASIELGERRFVGCTLWFAHDADTHRLRHALTDFHLIAGIEERVYADHARARAFLEETTRPGDIVVTHHLPAARSLAPHFRAEPYQRLAPFFATDCEAIMTRCRPALWIHGHMHVPADWRHGDTRVVCNPIGYPRDRGAGRLDFVVDV